MLRGKDPWGHQFSFLNGETESQTNSDLTKDTLQSWATVWDVGSFLPHASCVCPQHFTLWFNKAAKTWLKPPAWAWHLVGVQLIWVTFFFPFTSPSYASTP